MNDEPGQLDPSGKVRASDAEREAVVERLRVAAVEGRLTLGELTERTGAAYTATTRGELVPITADLPEVPSSPAVPARPTGGDREWVVAVMGDSRREGRWRVERPLSAVAVMGDVVLDLRGAEVPHGNVDITAVAVMGDVKVYVPDGVDVELSGFAVMGDKKVRVRAAVPQGGGQGHGRHGRRQGRRRLLRRTGSPDPAGLAHPRRPRPPRHRVASARTGWPSEVVFSLEDADGAPATMGAGPGGRDRSRRPDGRRPAAGPAPGPAVAGLPS